MNPNNAVNAMSSLAEAFHQLQISSTKAIEALSLLPSEEEIATSLTKLRCLAGASN